MREGSQMWVRSVAVGSGELMCAWVQLNGAQGTHGGPSGVDVGAGRVLNGYNTALERTLCFTTRVLGGVLGADPL